METVWLVLIIVVSSLACVCLLMICTFLLIWFCKSWDFGKWFYSRKHKVVSDETYEKKKCKGDKNAFVTGGTSTMGLEMAKALYKIGYNVVIASLENGKADDVLKEHFSDSDLGNKAHFIYFDLNDSDTVYKCVEEYKKLGWNQLDILINNAGILMLPEPQTAKKPENCEKTFAINYVNHFLLTKLLFPELRKSESPRVVCQGSSNYVFIKSGEIFDQVMGTCPKMNQAFTKYSRSKLALMYMMMELQERCENAGFPILCFSTMPGMVNTDIYVHMGCVENCCLGLIRTLGMTITPFLGAQTAIYCALSDDIVKHGGSYVDNFKVIGVEEKFQSDLPTDVGVRKKVWKIAEDLLNEKFDVE